MLKVENRNLSPQQKRILGSPSGGKAPRAVLSLLLTGEVEHGRLKESLDRLVARHDMLRSHPDSAAAPASAPDPDRERAYFRTAVEPVADRDSLGALVQGERQNAEIRPLLRATLVPFENGGQALVLSVPAACCDGRGLLILAEELAAGYEYGRGEQGPESEPVRYAQYIEWLRELAKDGESGREFWESRWREAVPAPALPFQAEGPFNQARYRTVPGRALRESMEGGLQALDASAEVFLLTCWQILLARMGPAEAITVGCAFDGRSFEELAGTVGPFTRFLPITAAVSETATFADLLRRTEERWFDAEEWQDYQGLEEYPAHLVELGFEYETVPPPWTANGIRFEVIDREPFAEPCSLKLQVLNNDEDLALVFSYDAGRFGRDWIESLTESFQCLAIAAAASPHAAMGSLPLLSGQARAALVSAINDTAETYPETRADERFGDWAGRVPDRVALTLNHNRVTYGALNRRANRLARNLNARGVGSDTVVAVCLPRSFAMIEALLAVLKAGGAYLPLDAKYPAERLRFTIRDSGAALLLATGSATPFPDNPEPPTLLLEDGMIGEEPCSGKPAAQRHPDQLAYLIYTSGSTGRPKGVMITHRGLANYLSWSVARYGLDECRDVPLHGAIGFDATVTSLWGPLTAGGSLALFPEEAEIEALRDLAASSGNRGFLKITPAHLRLLGELLPGETAGLPFRTVVLGGEALSRRDLARWRGSRHTTWVNEYGPTETVVGSCVHFFDRLDDAEGDVPIGLPIANTRLYVLNRYLVPQPPGVAGQLYIAGFGLARGYRRRPDETAARFVPNPFERAAGSRMYATGDSVLIGREKVLAFLGRIDNQIKIRGFRVELGEIEAVLAGHPGLTSVAVTLSANGNESRVLVAHLVPGDSRNHSGIQATIRGFLQERLPEYMVPQHYLIHHALPLTDHGKIDRNRLAGLPLPELAASSEAPPANATEETLAALWRESLNIDAVGVHDVFFDLGGHSLSGTILMHRVSQGYGVSLSLADLFAAPTIRGLANRIHLAQIQAAPTTAVEALLQELAPRQDPDPDLADLGFDRLASLAERVTPLIRAEASIPSQPRPRGTVSFPLSFAQQRLWFLYRYHPESPGYNVVSAARLQGPLHLAAVEAAVEAIVARHEILRTTYTEREGETLQLVHPAAPLSLTVLDLAAASLEGESLAAAIIGREAKTPFDLAAGPVLRTLLLKLGPEAHIFILNCHHIASDGWSGEIFMKELQVHYRAFLNGADSPLAPLPIQYGDFSAWQRTRLQGSLLAAQSAYWKEKLVDLATLDLPLDRPRPPEQTFEGARLGFAISREATLTLRAFSREQGVTLFMTVLAALKAVLYRYSGQEDVVIGVPFANRPRPELKELIGFFINTLPLRTRFDARSGFGVLLSAVRDTTLEAQAHQELPFEKLVDELRLARDPSRTPVYQVVLNYGHSPDDPGSGADEVELDFLSADTETAIFDLIVQLQDAENGLFGWLNYNRNLFDRETVKGIARHFGTLLERLADCAEHPAATLPMLTEEDWRALTRGRVAEPGAFQPLEGETLHGRFQCQAERRPEAAALVSRNRVLTYAFLDARSNRLARVLAERGVGLETRVGLCYPRSEEPLVAMLAILKAGGTYVPLDPRYPQERKELIANDAGLALILTTHDLAAELPAGSALVSDVFRDAGPPTAPMRRVVSANAAYAIYTSGSTGKPKGVLVTHGHVLRLFGATDAWFGFDESDVWTLFHSFAFDFSVWETWGALLHGGRLVVVPYWLSRSPEEFRALCAAQAVTVLNQSPSAFRQWVALEEAGNPAHGLRLRTVIFGAEALDVPALEPWFRRQGDRKPLLVNMYGITETTVHVSYRPIAIDDLRGLVGSPIGVPIPDLDLFVLDSVLNPVPAGAAGELFVGGSGPARGYLDRPDLTAHRFVPNPYAAGPFGNLPGARLYRTGDRARRMRDGECFFLGRTDRQLKIRGFRIEPGEIQSALAQHPDVAQCLVLAQADGDGPAQLAGYVIPRPETAPDAADLHDFLSTRLPEYMVPSGFVFLDAFPMTAHGKLDRAALPAPNREPGRSGGKPALPLTETEEVLAAIWADALNLKEVGRDDNFFALGGDSIRSIKVLAQAKKRGLALDLQQLFKYQTVRLLARKISGRHTGSSDSGAKGAFGLVPDALRARLPESLEDAYPMSKLQQGMIYHMEREPETRPYHNVNSWRLRGEARKEPFLQAVQVVVNRHAVLRTGFHVTGYDLPIQVVHRTATLPVRWFDLRAQSPEERDRAVAAYIAEENRATFDLAKPTLLRFAVHRLTDLEFRFSLTECHAILDGWSLTSALAEIFELYFRLCDGEAPAPEPPPKAPFREFIRMERAALTSEDHRAFWKTRLADCERPILPPWMENPVLGDGLRQTELARGFPEEWNRSLKDMARELQVPLKSVLLAAHLKVLHALCGRTDILTSIQINSRPEIEGGERAYGLFLNAMPFRYRLRPGTWADLIRGLFQWEWEAIPYRAYPMAAIQEWFGNAPIFETIFNYLHFHSLSGLFRSGRLEVVGDEMNQEPNNYALTANFHVNPVTGDLSLILQSNSCGRAHLSNVMSLYQAALSHLVQSSATMGAVSHQHAVLTAAAQRQWLAELNDTAAPFPGQCLHAGFAARAVRAPEAVAVSADGKEEGRTRFLTNERLDREARKLAGILRAKGVGPDVPVALCMTRSPELILSILAILQAGGAYLPLDPEYPEKRMRFMLEDSGARTVLVHRHGNPKGREAFLDWLTLSETVDVGALPDLEQDVSLPDSGALPDRLAYIVYTSGSTGRPKGVMATHRNVARLVFDRVYVDFRTGDRMAQVSNVSFDAFTFEMWTPLLLGGCLCPIEQEVFLQADRFAVELARKRIDVLFITTAYFNQLARMRPELFHGMRYVLFGGEQVHPGAVAEILKLGPSRLLHVYGPTETTTYASWHPVREVRPDAVNVPIGKPIANTAALICDDWLNLLPPGVTGELYLGGDGLARGYLKRPGRTARVFLPNPFAIGGRLYRTGDLARYDARGDIEFMGRADGQVKLRGFRIELGEIEARLSRHPSVSQAVVTVRETGPGEKRMAAYLTAESGRTIAIADLQAYLKKYLPAFMVPAAFVVLDAMPLTPNGKIDKKALPRPETDSGVGPTAKPNELPRTPMETLLAEYWAKLLRIEAVGPDDDFFELGGHSLSATRLISQVRESLKLEIPLRSIFEASTLTAFAQRLEAAQKQGLGLAAPPMVPVSRERPLPLSFSQQRLWFLDRFEPDNPTYLIPVPILLHGSLDLKAVAEVYAEIVDRHEVLRTGFPDENGQPRQEIADQIDVSLPVVEVAGLSGSAKDTEISSLIAQGVKLPFDLAHGPLSRVTVLRLDAETHLLLMVIHHIVSDGWSAGIFTGEFTAIYRSKVTRTPSMLPELPLQYADFADWQRSWLSGPVLETQMSFWRGQLGDAAKTLDLPTDYERPKVRTFLGHTLDFRLGAEEIRKVRSLAREEGATVFMVLLAAFKALLYRYSGQPDLCVGTPIANRNRREIENLIGFFVNTLVLRTRLEGGAPFRSLLTRVRETALAAYAHQDMPFEKLVDDLQPDRSLKWSPLFQVMFSYQTARRQETLELPGIRVEAWGIAQDSAKFDLTLTLTETEEGLSGSIGYNTDLFRQTTILRMIRHYASALTGFAEDAGQAPDEIALLSPGERHQILLGWNRTAANFGQPATVAHIFETRALQSADASALVYDPDGEGYGERFLSYGCLNARATGLAHVLRARGAMAEVLVGIYLPRDPDMVVALLGILKAGGAYLPLDPAYPEERRAFMLADSGAPLLICADRAGRTRLPAGVRPLPLTELADFSAPADAPLPQPAPHHPAYLIYTSGSTGKPKGVAVDHRALWNYLCWVRDVLFDDSLREMPMVTPLSFDACLKQLFGVFARGGRVRLPAPGTVEQPAILARQLARAGGTALNCIPSLWQGLLEAVASGTADLGEKDLTALYLSGDRLGASLYRETRRRFPKLRVWNVYGPTETAVNACAGVLEPGQPIHMGRPVANLDLYVLGPGFQPQPAGVSGELYIGGAGLARGYHRRPGTTATCFLPNPVGPDPGSRLYRTGDRVRHLADGRIVFGGRIDRQVKLRGYRLELGEIERVLAEHNQVGEAVVELRTREGTASSHYLTAYLVRADKSGEPLEPARLRDHLAKRLPDYMVPAFFVTLPDWPLLPNGKVDRRALPAPDSVSRTSLDRDRGPRSREETALAEIWREVLGIERVGIHDNFFELGGDSILSIQITVRARGAGLLMTPKQLFEHQTIADLAAHIDAATAIEAEQGRVLGALPLTPIQHLFFERGQAEPHHYNQSLLLEVPADLNPPAANRAWLRLSEHHDALRLRFHSTASGWVQEISDEPASSLSVLDLSGLPAAERPVALELAANRVQAGLDFTFGPLARAALFLLGSEKPDAPARTRLLIAIHHLAVDAVSWRILLEDLQNAYFQAVRGRPIELPPKTSSVKEWAHRLAGHAATVAEELPLWLSGEREAAGRLPLDRDPSVTKDANSRAAVEQVALSLDRAQTERLLREATRSYRTGIEEILLTALALTLTRRTKSRSIRVALEGHGREELFQDLDISRTVGWFTNLYPVHLEIPENGEPGAALKRVKETLRRPPHRGMGFGLLRYLHPDESVRAKLAALPAPEVGFNYLGQVGAGADGTSAFKLAGEASGQAVSGTNARDLLLEVAGYVADGRLTMSWSYSRHLHDKATVEDLCHSYLADLQGLVDYCCSPEAGGYTPSDFPLAAVSQEQLDEIHGEDPQVADLLPLSPMQEGLLFQCLLEAGSPSYFGQTACIIRGNFNAEAFKRAWAAVLERHTLLRTSFRWEGFAKPIQLVHQHCAPHWIEGSLDHETPEADRAWLDAFMAEDRARGFDFAKAPLMRFALFNLGEDRHRFIWSHHHLLMDGWSVTNVIREVFLCYHAHTRGSEPELAPAARFREYIAWLREQDFERAKAFWHELLAGFATPTPLIGDRGADPDGGREPIFQLRNIRLPAGETSALKELVKANRLTLSTVVQTAWAVLLGRYAGETDVVFGVTVSGRPATLADSEEMVGLFINTLPVRARLRERADLMAWIAEWSVEHLDRESHAYYPLIEIQRDSQVPQGRSLFDSIVVFQNFPIDDGLQAHAEGLTVEDVVIFQQSHYPLTLTAVPGQDLFLELCYDSSRFGEATILRMLGHLRTLLEGIASIQTAGKASRIGGLPLLTAEERRRSLSEWNRTQSDFGPELRLHRLFALQAERTPESTAVGFDAEAPGLPQYLTFGGLQGRVSRLAAHLRGLGVNAENLAAICTERCPEMPIGLLAILQAGGAYLPLDPDYPKERLALMLEDSGASVSLTGKKHTGHLPGTATIVDLDDFPLAASRDPVPVLNDESAPENAAYVIYTSGSTGKPKGVIVPHRGIVNRVLWMQAAYPLYAQDKVLQKTAISFDASGWEIYAPLFAGAQIVLARPGGQQDPAYLAEAIDRHRVTRLQVVPTLLKVLLEEPRFAGLTTLDHVFSGGEALSAEVVDRYYASMPAKLVNLYGPTEASIDAASWPCPLGEPGPVMPLGRPIANDRLHILDGQFRPVPVGVAGELYIGGAGLARGYRTRPALTALRFGPDPFSAETQSPPGERLYRTGDLACYREDGTIAYLGRADDQVKLRGFRIEPGEIEAVLTAHPEVRDARVILKGDRASASLIAYLIPRKLHRLPNRMEVAYLNANETDLIYREIFEDHGYLKHGIELRDGDCVFDVGANIGMFTLYAHQLRKDLRVFAFEPLPPIFDILRANVQRFGLEVELFDLGLSDSRRSVTATFYPKWSAMSGIYADATEETMTRAALRSQGDLLKRHEETLLAGRFERQTHEVRLATLSEVMRDRNVDRIDLLKIDAEKSEMDVLLGIEGGDWPKIRQIAMEVHDIGGRLDHVRDLLKRMQFRVVAEEDPRFRGTGLYNLYAVSEAAEARPEGEPAPSASQQPRLTAKPVDWREYLAGKLPEFMVPAAFVSLDAFPLLPNGKIDIGSLPDPGEGTPRRLQIAAERTATQEIIAAIWSELLQVPVVDTTDNFFELGGHSISAILLLSRLRKAFGRDFPLKDIFDIPNLAEMARYVEQHRRGNRTGPPPLQRVPGNGPLPLSFAQQRLWFLSRFVPENPQYNINLPLHLEGPLDIAALEACYREIVRRHEVLRTVYVEENGVPVQVVRPETAVRIRFVDFGGLPQTEIPGTARTWGAREMQRGFDLSEGPLIRLNLARVAPGDHLLLAVMHHIVSDGWSTGLFVRECALLYRSFIQRQSSPLAELPLQYADFASWQRRWLEGEVLERQWTYWRERLADAPALLELPVDRPRPASQTTNGATLGFQLDAEQRDRLNRLCRKEGATLFMALLAAFKIFLARYCGQEDLCVGTPVANRNHPDTEGMIGFFVNTLVLRSQPLGNLTFTAFLRQVRETSLDAYAHQDLPFEQLVDALEPERRMDRTPLFQVMFIFQNAGGETRLDLPGLQIGGWGLPQTTAKFDLSLAFTDLGDALAAAVEYNTDLFEETTVDRMFHHFRVLVRALLADPEQPLAEAPLLDPEDRELILSTWNRTGRPYPESARIETVFEDAANHMPDAAALRGDGYVLTYRKLGARADALAFRLRQGGLTADEPVGMFLEAGPTAVIAQLAILKAGGAYVPLDRDYPAMRLRLMARDTGLRFLIAKPGDPAMAPLEDLDEARILCPEEMENGEIPPAVQAPNPGARGLAYIMFTSGSTGQPNGVAVPHRAVVRLVKNTDYVDITPRDVFIQAASIAFDAATFEIWGPLLNRAQLVTMPSRSVDLLPELLPRHRVTVLWLTAQLFHMMLDRNPESLSGVRQLLAGGEALSRPHVLTFAKRFPDNRLINGYGPTEATTFSCCGDLRELGVTPFSAPLGPPIANTRVYVLDSRLNPVPAGVAGELFIGGHGLARGYWQRPVHTASRFVPDPFGVSPGERLYRTGDKTRFLADGIVEFLGRFDAQVKVRGFRIEPGEIQSAMARYPGIRETAVLVRNDPPEPRLTAYFVADPENPITVAELRAFLMRELPPNTVPAAFVRLNAMPLTPNGKLDFRALPAPGLARGEAEPEVEELTPVQAMLAGFWTELLGLERVALRDNFFELGGHSLLATQLVSRIKAGLGAALPLRAVFEHPTLAGLSERNEQARMRERGLEAPPIVPVPRGEPLPLSFAQQRLWFVQRMDPASTAYHLPFSLTLEGALDARALEASLAELVRRHEVLRTVFEVNRTGDPVQVVQPFAPPQLPMAALDGLKREPVEERLRHLALDAARLPFDLSRGPLFRACLVSLGETRYAVLITMHHIAFDGWSMGILTRELAHCYRAMVSGEPPGSAPLPIQFGDYAVWQRSWLTGEAYRLLIGYWRERLASLPARPKLPCAFDPPRTGNHAPGFQFVAFTPELTQGLNDLARKEGATLFMVLLAGFKVLAHGNTGETDQVLGTDVANRNHGEIEGLIGFFVNQLVLRTDLGGDPHFRELLRRVRETTLEAYAHQDMPFDKLVQELNPERAASSPFFRIKFVLQNAAGSALTLPGLRIGAMPSRVADTKFDLLFNLGESETNLSGSLMYDGAHFDEKRIDRLLEGYRAVLERAVADCETRLSNFSALLREERARADRRDKESLEAARLNKFRNLKRKTQRNPVAGGDS